MQDDFGLKKSREFLLVFGYFLLLILAMIATKYTFLGIQDETHLQATLKAATVYNYMTSYPLALIGGWLYTHFPHGQWYSVIMSFYVFFMAFIMSFYVINIRFEAPCFRRFLKIILLGIFSLLIVYTLLEVDVTTPTLLLVALAVPLIKKHPVHFFAILWVASFLREQILFSVLPLIVLTLFLQFDKRYFDTKRTLLSLLFIAGIAFNHFSYKLDEGYAKWMKFTEARAYFTDFNGPYKGVITPDQYHIAKSWWIIDESLYPGNKIEKAAGSTANIVKTRIINHGIYRTVRAVYLRHPELKFLLFFSLLIPLFHRSWIKLGAYGLFAIGFFLLLAVKDVERVTFPLLLLWWTLILADFWRLKKTNLRQVSYVFSIMILFWIGYTTYRTLPMDRITHYRQKEQLQKEFKNIIQRSGMHLEVSSGWPMAWEKVVEALMQNHLFDETHWADYNHALILNGWLTHTPIIYKQHQISHDGIKRKYDTFYQWLINPHNGIISSKERSHHINPFLVTKLLALYDKVHPKKGYRHALEVVDESKHFIIYRVILTDKYISRFKSHIPVTGRTMLFNVCICHGCKQYNQTCRGHTIIVSNSDPHLVLPAINTAHKFLLLDLTFTSPSHTVLQLFFKTKPTDRYLEGHSVRFNVHKGENRIQLKIPATYFANGLRIDLANKAGNYTIKNFAVYALLPQK